MSKSQDALNTTIRTLAEVRALTRYLVEVVELQQHEPELKKFRKVGRLLDEIVSTASSHVDALDRHLALLGATLDPVKQSTAAMAGAFLGFITKLRSHDTSKILRDDCTLLNLVHVKCYILRTTALALHQRDIGTTAGTMIAELTPLIEECRQLLPEVLVEELSRTFGGLDKEAAAISGHSEPAPVSLLTTELAATA